MTQRFSRRRRVTLVALALAISATGLWLFFAKPDSRLTIRFLGYIEGKPYLDMNPAVLGGQVSPRQTMRVAQLSISNGNDFAVGGLLTIRYTNGQWGAFVPQNIHVAPHTVTEVIGVIVPTASNAPPASYPSSPDWTRSWRVRLYASEAPPLQGIRASREQAAMWLYQHKYFRLGSFVNARKVQKADSDLIPPDSTSAQ